MRTALAISLLLALSTPAHVEDEASTAAVLAALTSDDAKVREKAAESLHRLYLEPKDIPALVEVVEAERARESGGPTITAMRVISAIGSFGPDAAAAAPLLLEMAKAHPGDSTGIVAVEALGRIGPAARIAVPYLTGVIEAANEKALAEWRGADDRVTWNESAAAAALGGIGDAPDAVPALANAVRLWPSGSRGSAVWALGRLGEPAKAAIPVLVEALDRSWIPEWPGGHDPRRTAARALAALGPESVLPLALRLHSDSHPVPFFVLDALEAMGPQAGRACHLVAAACSPGGDDELRQRAVEVLARIDPEPREMAVRVLLDRLHDKSTWVAGTAAVGLAKLAPESEKAIREIVLAYEEGRVHLDGPTGVGDAIVSYGRLAVEPLLNAMTRKYGHQNSPAWRDMAARLLGRIGELSPLLEVLEGEDEELAAHAFVAVHGLGRKAEPAIPALAKLLGARNPNLANRSAAFLVRLGPVSLPELERFRDSRPSRGWDGKRELAKESIETIRREAEMARRAPPSEPASSFRPAFAPGEAEPVLVEDDLVVWRTEGAACPPLPVWMRARGVLFTLHVQRLDGSPMHAVPVRESSGATGIGPLLDDGTICVRGQTDLRWVSPEGRIDRQRVTLDGEEAQVVASYRDGFLLQPYDLNDRRPVWFVPLEGRDLVEAKKVRITGEAGVSVNSPPRFYRMGDRIAFDRTVFDLRERKATEVEGGSQYLNAFDGEYLVYYRRSVSLSTGRTMKLPSERFLCARDGFLYWIENGFPGYRDLRVLDLTADVRLGWVAAELPYQPDDRLFFTNAGITFPENGAWLTVPWLVRRR